MAEKIALLCPVAQVINPKVFQNVLAMVSYASSHGCEITQIGVTERTLIHQARNQLAIGFMNTDCEWAMWIDSDMLFPADTVPRLLETAKKCNAKFVTGVYYQRLGEHLPVLWRKQPVLMDGKLAPMPKNADPDKNEAYLHHFIVPTGQLPIRADVAGFGCILMHREMLEKIPKPYFKMISDDCSEDFYFCIKAKEAGYELWADPSLELFHEGQPKWISKKDMVLPKENLIEVQR